MRRKWIVCASVLGLLGAAVLPTTGFAQSKSAMIDICNAEAKDTYGEVDVTFGKIRREENRNYAYGEILMADGTTRRIRCKVTRRKVRSLMLDNPSGGLGYRWTNDIPDGGFLLPEDEPESEVPDTDGDEAAAVDLPDGDPSTQLDPEQQPPRGPSILRVPQ
ncbi:MAG: hypothetical protein AAF409_04220 [Pseudomonadota bacterium]